MNNKPYIYRKQIIATGKYYIGKHNGNNKNYKGSGTEWMKDYKMYIKDRKTDLIEEILEYVEDITKLNEREKYWLEKFNAANNPLYYNLTNKSHGLEFQTEYTKLLKKEAWKGRIHHWGKQISQGLIGKNKGKVRTQDTKNKISNSMKNHPSIIGNKERGKKISESNKGQKRPEFGEKMKGRVFSDLHLKNMKKPKPEGFNDKLKKKIIQLDEYNNIINKFNSLTEAAKLTGLNIQAISLCALGKTKSSGGFIWKYEN
jgi:hypothetical protein